MDMEQVGATHLAMGDPIQVKSLYCWYPHLDPTLNYNINGFSQNPKERFFPH